MRSATEEATKRDVAEEKHESTEEEPAAESGASAGHTTQPVSSSLL
jgi:hypothetical protein